MVGCVMGDVDDNWDTTVLRYVVSSSTSRFPERITTYGTETTSSLTRRPCQGGRRR